ncbi:MAG: carboxylesterase family protein [Sphingobium sp.]
MNDRIVETQSGKVRGMVQEGTARFLGIPYAAPPVGLLRFAVPEAPAPWSGVRDALEPGPNAPQPRARNLPGLDVFALVGEGWVEGDDYLTLNIWAPDGQASGLPVMVFVHGGAFVLGSKDVALHDGSAFAHDGAVCVAINYRMGTEGFLPIPKIPTNLGLRDQIFAIQWVRDNVCAFGGDPDNITVFGESAGAMSIANLIASPLATGLFRRAIVQSGHGGMTRDMGVAQRLVKKLAKIAGISPNEAGYRSKSAGDLIAAVEKVNLPTTRLDLRDRDGREPVFGISRFVPVHGDDVLPLPPLEALAQGEGADIDLLIGTNAEEMNLYFVPTNIKAKLGRLLSTYIMHRSVPKANRLLKAYGMGQQGVKPSQAFTDAATDVVFRWPARRFAEEHRGRTHVYEFDWRSPRFAEQGGLGASHGMELPFVFDTLSTVSGPEGLCGESPPQELANCVHRIWLDFARDGSLPWGEFTRDQRLVHHLAREETVTEPPMPAAPFLP